MEEGQGPGGAEQWEVGERGFGREEGGREVGKKAFGHGYGLEGRPCRHGLGVSEGEEEGEDKERGEERRGAEERGVGGFGYYGTHILVLLVPQFLFHIYPLRTTNLL